MNKKSRNFFLVIGIILIVLALILIFSLNSQNPSARIVDSGASGEVKEFDIIAEQFSFIPSTITVNKGDTVVINVKSRDVEHGISIPEFNVNENFFPGEEKKIRFVADKRGTFSFYCSIYCGSGHGNMKGQLIVK